MLLLPRRVVQCGLLWFIVGYGCSLTCVVCALFVARSLICASIIITTMISTIIIISSITIVILFVYSFYVVIDLCSALFSVGCLLVVVACRCSLLTVVVLLLDCIE